MRASTRRSPRDDHHQAGELRKRSCSQRRGNIIIFSVFLMILMMGMLAFSVDVGYMYTMETQLQRSVDAAALAGAGSLAEGTDIANDRVVEYLVRNPVGSEGGDGDLSARMAAFLAERGGDLQVEMGHWDPVSKQFTPSDAMPSTISVSLTYPNNPLFFARFLGHDRFTIEGKSIASYQPRDIMVVLDFSGSMNDDTEFKSIPALGREVVEANIQECWNDLGSPTYGDMEFEPEYITLVGEPPQEPSLPQITVEYRYDEVYVTSSKDLSNVVLEFSDGSSQRFEGLSGYTQTFSGTDYNTGKAIYKVWVKAGENHSGDGSGFGEPFDFHPNVVDQVVLEYLGLDSAAYPYPSGSWQSYIDWCQSGSSQNDDYGGYRWKFGYKNLFVYWLEQQPAHSQTPDLWMTSAQPVQAVKSATNVFTQLIQQVETDDRVGLAIYNGPGGDGFLEVPLTNDFDAVSNAVLLRQAGHYHNYTNIGGGLHSARQELETNGRAGAFKMVVLMTDGLANWVGGGYDPAAARAYVLNEAGLYAEKRYPILSVSLGAGADTALMQEVADATPDGRHFNIPGGQTGQEYYEDLVDAFREIAKHRPLKLVQ